MVCCSLSVAVVCLLINLVYRNLLVCQKLFGVSAAGREGLCSLNTLSVSGFPPLARNSGVSHLPLIVRGKVTRQHFID